MTKDEIIEMVMQIGGCDRPEDDSPALKMFVTFAKLVAEKAIKEALAQPDQEPVAWMDEYGDVLSASVVSGKGLRNIPLYTAPPQRTWVGLTQTQVKLLWEGVREEAIKSGDSLNWVFYTHINEALKEKNT